MEEDSRVLQPVAGESRGRVGKSAKRAATFRSQRAGNRGSSKQERGLSNVSGTFLGLSQQTDRSAIGMIPCDVCAQNFGWRTRRVEKPGNMCTRRCMNMIYVYTYMYMKEFKEPNLHRISQTHPCMHTHMHACMNACMHACMHAYIHTYIHTYTHTHIYIYSQGPRSERKHVNLARLSYMSLAHLKLDWTPSGLSKGSQELHYKWEFPKMRALISTPNNDISSFKDTYKKDPQFIETAAYLEAPGASQLGLTRLMTPFTVP